MKTKTMYIKGDIIDTSKLKCGLACFILAALCLLTVDNIIRPEWGNIVKADTCKTDCIFSKGVLFVAGLVMFFGGIVVGLFACLETLHGLVCENKIKVKVSSR